MKVAVVIPVYNEEAFIQKTLEAFLKQEGPRDFALVIADNGSTDTSVGKIKAFQRRHRKLPIILTFEKKKGTRFARKKALDVAASLNPEIIAGTDADCLVPKDFIAQIVDCFRSKECDVYSGKIFLPPKTRLLRLIFFPKIINLIQLQWQYETRFFGPYFFGGHFALKAKLYNRISFFNFNQLPVPINHDDIILSKRCVYLGASFSVSKNYVIASDRRFWANIKGYLAGEREADYRQTNQENPLKLSEKEKKHILMSRYDFFNRKILALLWDACLFWQATHHNLAIPYQTIKKTTAHFGIPTKKFLRLATTGKPLQSYQKLCKQFKRRIGKQVEQELKPEL